MALDCCFAPVQPLLPKDRLVLNERLVSAKDVDMFISDLQSSLTSLLEEAWDAESEADSNGVWRDIPTKKLQNLRVRYANVDGLKGALVATSCIIDVEASKLFRFMVSVEGMKVIDPDTKNHNDNVIETVPWRDRAEVTYAVAPMGGLVSPRTFLVLNAMDYQANLFVSGPVLHSSKSRDEEASKGWVRCQNLFALETRPVKDEPGKCELRHICWLDMGGSIPLWLSDGFLKKEYAQALHKRLFHYMKHHPKEFA